MAVNLAHPFVMNLKHPTILAGVVFWLAATAASGQTNLDSSSQPNLDGQAVSPEKLTATDLSTTANLRPARDERKKLPPAVLQRIELFKRDARAYLEKQEALKKQLQGSNDRERDIVRQKIRLLREQWLERAREFRKEFRDRQQELKIKMPDYSEVLDSVNAARQAAAQSQPGTRPHRGEE